MSIIFSNMDGFGPCLVPIWSQEFRALSETFFLRLLRGVRQSRWFWGGSILNLDPHFGPMCRFVPFCAALCRFVPWQKLEIPASVSPVVSALQWTD